jgi:hypothetical protein
MVRGLTPLRSDRLVGYCDHLFIFREKHPFHVQLQLHPKGCGAPPSKAAVPLQAMLPFAVVAVMNEKTWRLVIPSAAFDDLLCRPLPGRMLRHLNVFSDSISHNRGKGQHMKSVEPTIPRAAPVRKAAPKAETVTLKHLGMALAERHSVPR